MTFELALGPRIAKSPFFDCTVAAGATRFSVYNHMLLPMSYGDELAEYWRLIDAVVMWDVSVQVQVELAGPDAGALAQAVVCRDLSRVAVGQARYAPMVDHSGRLLNDPLVLRVGSKRWWLSLADSDMVYWCRAVAAERGLDATVTIPDVSPLAVQGPLAEDVVADLLGEWVRELGFFRYRPTTLKGIPLWVGRAGWSKQGGFELYLLDRSRGCELWHMVADTGKPYGIGPGAPSNAERIESFLLSYRGDTPDDVDPLEVGLGRFLDLDPGVEFIGREALQKKRAAGLRRQLVGVWIDGDPVGTPEHPWPAMVGSRLVGAVRAAAFSPRLERNIGLALVDIPHNRTGSELTVHHPAGYREVTVADLPFCGPGRL
jgi:aminomethyltransferase